MNRCTGVTVNGGQCAMPGKVDGRCWMHPAHKDAEREQRRQAAAAEQARRAERAKAQCEWIFDESTFSGQIGYIGNRCKALGGPADDGIRCHHHTPEMVAWRERRAGPAPNVPEMPAWRANPLDEIHCESPIEVAFLREMRLRGLERFEPNVSVHDGAYRIDFADAGAKIGVELDGHRYHSDRNQFVADRRRHRELELTGWRLIRFAGREIVQDVASCVDELEMFVRAVTS